MGPEGIYSHLPEKEEFQLNGEDGALASPMIRDIELFKIKYWRHMFSFNSEQWST